jgi:thioredoxin
MLGLRRILQRVTRSGKGGSEDAMTGPDAVPSFDELIERSPVPVLVEFWAEWCGACRSLSPALGRIASEYKGVLVAIKVNVDRKPHLASRYQVSSIPTVILFRQNRIVLRFSGAVPFEEFKSRLDDALRSP